MKDPAHWLEDITIFLSEEEITSMLSDVQDTLAFTGSKALAALWLTFCALLGGVFAGVAASSQLWTSLLFVTAYLAVLAGVWMGMRKLTMRIFGPAIRWQAVLAFFWAFLLGIVAVAGGQMDTSGWGYVISMGGGLLIGVVCGSVNPPFIKHEDAWLLVSLQLGMACTALATAFHRGVLEGAGTLSAGALTGGIAALAFTFPMMVLLMYLWNIPHGLRHEALIYLHNDAFAGKAIDCLDRAIRLAPNDADLFNLRGIAWSRANDSARAEADWRKVLELQPDYAEPHLNRGTDFLRQGAIDKAVACFETAVRLDPKLAKAHSNLGAALEKRGDFDRAIEHYDRAIGLVPKYAKAYSNRGYARFRAGQHQLALEDCDRAIKLDAGLAMAYVNRGHALAAMGDLDRAAEDYQSALDMAPAPEVELEAETGLRNIRVRKGPE